MPVYIADYLADTQDLTTFQHGAFLLLLFAYWRKGKALDDNDATLAQIARCSLKEWKANRTPIAQKFDVASGIWWSKRLEQELAKASANYEKKSKAGAEGAKRRWQKDGKGIANASQTQSQTDAPSQPHSPNGETSPVGDGATRPKPTKGTRLANDWQPSAADCEYARKLNLTDAEIEFFAAQFRRWWTGPDAKRPVKKDWHRAWCNWLDRGAADVISRRPRVGSPQRNGRGPGSVLAALGQILDQGSPGAGGVGEPAEDTEIHPGTEDAGDDSGAARSSGIGGGVVIDAEWKRMPEAAGGTEIHHPPEGGEHGRHRGTDRDLRTETGSVSGGCGEGGFEDPSGGRDVVAGLEGTEGQARAAHAQAPDDADGLEIPSFLKRTA